MRKLTPHFLKSPYKDRSLSIWSQITTNWIGDLHSIKHRWISITLQVFIAPHPLTILLPRISLTQIPVCICHQLNPLMSNQELNSGTPTHPITAAWMQNHRRDSCTKSFESAQNSFKHVAICGSIMYRAFGFVISRIGSGNFLTRNCAMRPCSDCWRPGWEFLAAAAATQLVVCPKLWET